MGSVFGENSIYRAPEGRWAQEPCAGSPKRRYTREEPGKVQGRDRVRIVEGSYGYRARRVSFRGKFVLSKKHGVQYEGGRHVVKRSSDPWAAYPEVKV